MVNATRPGRLLLCVTMAISTLTVLVAAFYGMWVSVNKYQWVSMAFLPLLVVSWILMVIWILCEIPQVLFTEKGIWARFVFRKQFFPWTQILQAGILYRIGRGVPTNDFILLLSDGSPRRYKDKTFLLRNFGKVIHISAAEEIRNYVISHYGPLDFDLSNGQSEQSVEVE